MSTKSGFEAHQLDRQESTTNNNNYHQLSTMEYSQSDEIISPVLKLANLPSKPISDLPTEDFNRLAKLHVASFPIEMSDESIESQLIPLIKTHFNSERSKIKIVTAAREEYKIIFLEVFTLVKERDLNFILKNLSNEFFTFNNFNFTATFVVQKDSNWNNKVLHCDINSDDRIMNSLGKAESIVNFNNSKAGKFSLFLDKISMKKKKIVTNSLFDMSIGILDEEYRNLHPLEGIVQDHLVEIEVVQDHLDEK